MKILDYPMTGAPLRPLPDNEAISFVELRKIADTNPDIRYAIEERKDLLSQHTWYLTAEEDSNKLRQAEALTWYPDLQRMIVEDLLVLGCTAFYAPVGTDTCELIDAATVRILLDEKGRRPAPPNPAYHIIIPLMLDQNFTTDQLAYFYDPLPHKVYGIGFVEYAHKATVETYSSLMESSEEMLNRLAQIYTALTERSIGTGVEWKWKSTQ